VTELEVDAAIRSLQRLYPKWEPTQDEVQGWRRMIGRFDGLQLVEEAMQAAWEDTDFARPSRKLLRHHLAQQRQATGQKADDDPFETVETGVYAQCVEAPEDAPGRLGHCMAVAHGKHRIPPPDVLQAEAQNLCDRYAARYGGRWRVLRDATWADVIRMRAELQAATVQGA